MDWTEQLAALKSGRRQFAGQMDSFNRQGRAKVDIYCAKGCSSCCSLVVNCSFPESVDLAKNLTERQRQSLAEKIPLLRQISLQAADLKQFLRLFRQQLGGCPFLHPADGSCGVYPLRPFSCRALLSTRNSSWCAVDFAALHPLEKEAFLSSLDPEVVAFPTHYLASSQELGIELEVQQLIKMREFFGVALSGNLLYQVWLEAEHRLSEIVTRGFSATRTYLEKRDLDLPFLLQLQGN